MTATKKKERAPMQVPTAFRELLMKEAESRGMSMAMLLERFGPLMVESIKNESGIIRR